MVTGFLRSSLWGVPGFINHTKWGTRCLNTSREGTRPASETTDCPPGEGRVTLRLGSGTSNNNSQNPGGWGDRTSPAQRGEPRRGASPRTIPLGSLGLALSCSQSLGMALGKRGALPYLGPPSGASGFGLCRAGLSQRCANIRVWPAGQASGGAAAPPARSAFRWPCPWPAPSCFSSALKQGLGLVASSGKFNSRKEEKTAGWNLHAGEWKASPAPRQAAGRGRAAEGGASGEEVEGPFSSPWPATGPACLPSQGCLGAPQGALHQWDRFRGQAGALGDLAWTCPLGPF